MDEARFYLYCVCFMAMIDQRLLVLFWMGAPYYLPSTF
jgi:hypothetical protein